MSTNKNHKTENQKNLFKKLDKKMLIYLLCGVNSKSNKK